MATSRRDFLQKATRGGIIAGAAGITLSSPVWLSWLLDGNSGDAVASPLLDELARVAPRARYWVSTDSKEADCVSCHRPEETGVLTKHNHKETVLRCQLCAQECFIREGKRGICRTRMNVDGELRSLVYGRPVSVHIDPIEKKPFYHFLPTAPAYSLATAGCPLHCKFCQNWELSQMSPEDYKVPYVLPETIVKNARAGNAPVIAFTYNEPTVFTEYLVDIARLAKGKGIRSVLISCGFMNSDPLREMCEVLDGIKIDLKGYSRDFYLRVCSAELDPVLDSIRQVGKSGTHLEIVNLVVPTLNDSDTMLRELSKWVMGEVGPDVPVHFTRFHPDYQLLNLSPTPVATLERARQIAIDTGINYAFVGNVPGHPGNNTYCPGCGKVVVERTGFFVLGRHITDGRCDFCGEMIAGVWQ